MFDTYLQATAAFTPSSSVMSRENGGEIPSSIHPHGLESFPQLSLSGSAQKPEDIGSSATFNASIA